MIYMLILTVVIIALSSRGAHADSWSEQMLAFPYKINTTESAGAHHYPFSFLYDGKPSDQLLASWKHQRKSDSTDPDKTKITDMWTDQQTGFQLTMQTVLYRDFTTVEWLLFLENTGSTDTPIISDLQAMDIMLTDPISNTEPYILHKTKGGAAGPEDFEAYTRIIDKDHAESMGGDFGRSSNKDLPFFKLEGKNASLIFGIGWSGVWDSRLVSANNEQIHITAGLKKTHFRLHPGERVRSPRILILRHQGDTLDSNSLFRRLISKHYTAKRNNKKPLPTLFCNTCFTKYGLGDTANAANQISLINAYGPLGLEAVVTDAGWYEGSQGFWPKGVGNWTPRKDNFPEGMRPVAAAARRHGMIYGLWYEIETVMNGTTLYNKHREWLLKPEFRPWDMACNVLNFGLPEVRDYLIDMLKGYMALPGFRMYRQDYGLTEPSGPWTATDAPDRQGITEMKYIEGLYDFWNRIAVIWPDSLREECSAGGRRIDLETVMHMHIHQKTDYWFDNEVDQSSLWGLSQYLPNNVFVAQLNKLDDYSFHSTLASSLCVCWNADEPGFDTKRAKTLISKYKAVRHLLTGDWYPLLPFTREGSQWLATQYHRSDLGEGMLLVFRRNKSPYSSITIGLKALKPDAKYRLSFDREGRSVVVDGSQLLKGIRIPLPSAGSSEMIVYKEC